MTVSVTQLTRKLERDAHIVSRFEHRFYVLLGCVLRNGVPLIPKAPGNLKRDLAKGLARGTAA